MKKPRAALFSVAIVCYRNFEFIYEAIDSVLQQNYSEIELIVCDDGSPNFPQEAIESYLENHRTPSIWEYSVYHALKNQGTVKNLNLACSLMHGEFMCFLAGDDTLYDENVLTRYTDGFLHSASECYVEMAQTAMFDRKMERLQGYYLQPEVQRLLEDERDQTPLYQLLAQYAYLPSTSTCFRRRFFDSHGKFDEYFFLVEDYPLHLRLIKEKILIHYESFIAIKHRDGGISHGASTAVSFSKRKYYEDILKCHEIVLNNLDLLEKTDAKSIKERYAMEKCWLEGQIYGRSPRIVDKVRFLVSHPAFCIKKVLAEYAKTGIYRKGKVLVAAALGGMCFSPDIAGMLEELSKKSFTAIGVLPKLYTAELFLFIIGLVILTLDVICKIMNRVERFPPFLYKNA